MAQGDYEQLKVKLPKVKQGSGAAATCDICGWEYLESELFRQDGYRKCREDLDNTGPASGLWNWR